jgi:hypothetical protein
VHLGANGNDMVHFSSLSFWTKAALSESEGEPIQNSSCTIDFTIFFCISQPLFNYNPTASHSDFFIVKVSTIHVLIPQVRPAHKYPISPWEMIHPPGGDNAVCMYAYTVYTAVCNKSLTATYQCKIQNSKKQITCKQNCKQ